ncbi:MAG: rod shape-determining protein RodA [Spirochaetales bacterium]|nr:rod shape-determining protein RodA [Spirochaetales bacterium]
MIRSKNLFSVDIYIFAATLSLMVIGILFIYSSGVSSTGIVFSREYIRQIIWVSGGTGLLILISMINYERFRDWSFYIFAAVVLLLIITLFFGKVVNGARSWLGIGNLGIQPSEFMKIAYIFFFATILERNRMNNSSLRTFFLYVLLLLLPIGLVMLQPDMGTAMVFFPIFLIMGYIGGLRIRHLLFLFLTAVVLIISTLLPVWYNYASEVQRSVFLDFLTNDRLVLSLLGSMGGAAVIALVGFWVYKRGYFYWIVYALFSLMLGVGGSLLGRSVLREYQLMRIIVFLNPNIDPRGAGWNIIQSVTAVGSGGVWGKGFLQGTQSHYRYLPQQSTDFIFSILSEEWGFAGALLVFSLFLVILIRGLYILWNAKDNFAVCAGAGILGMIFFHFAINVGMAIGIMPITGIPLFFLSYGGSSLWTALIGTGFLMSVYSRRYWT